MSLEKDREKFFGNDVETGQQKGGEDEEKEERRRQQEQQVNTTNSSSTLFQNQNQIRFHHLAAATGLIVTYLIEIIVQIFLIVVCCQSFVLFTSAWDWSMFLILSFAVSSLMVTIVSIIWVCRSLDFAGRLCGRLLCYVMHSLLLGLLWRYLKLAFVYDRADVQEFVALRILQAYFQSLPLTSIHLAWLISSRQNWSSLTLGIVLVEFLSIMTALVLSWFIKSSSSPSPPSTSSPCEDQQFKSKGEEQVVMQVIVKNLNCSSNRPSGSLWPQLLETKLYILSQSLLLCSRLIVIGIIIFHLKYWTCMFILVHFILSCTWISFSVNNSPSNRHLLLEEMEEVSLTKGKDFVTLITEWSYIIFWDVTSTLSHNINWCTWILPVLLVMLENGTIIIFHWYQTQDQVVTIISGSALLIGWLLFSSLNFVKSYSHTVAKCCSPHHPIHSIDKEMTHCGSITKDKSQQTSQTLPGVLPMIKNHHQHPLPLPSNNQHGCNNKKNQPSWDLNLFSSSAATTNTTHAPNTLPNNYHNLNEVLRTKVKSNVFNTEKFQQQQEARSRNGKKSKTDSSPEMYSTSTSTTMVRGSPREGPIPKLNPSQSPLLPSTTWVPDTCCNDSNGSSNSRNTNTLRETGNPIPDLDNLDNDTDVENGNFVFYFPTDTSIQQSVTSANIRSQKSSDNINNKSKTTNVEKCNLGGSSYRKPKKKSRSSSISSFSNIRRYRTSTPIEIKKASRILVNNPYHTNPKDSKTTSSPCYCYVDKTKTSFNKENNRMNEMLQQSVHHQPQYENLIEDSYGILICEGESSSTGMGPLDPVKIHHQQQEGGRGESHHHHSRLPFPNSQTHFTVLCAKCLQNHDPLLTNCVETDTHHTSTKDDRTSQVLLALGSSHDPSWSSPSPRHNSHHHHHYHRDKNPLNSTPKRPRQALPIPIPTSTTTMPILSSNSLVDDDDDPLPSDTTDYPSETEMTCTVEGDDEQLSVSSNLSTATYTTWPHSTAPNLSMWTTSTMMPQSRFPKEFTSLEYVRTWLLTSQARLWQHKQTEKSSSRSRLPKKVHRSNTLAVAQNQSGTGSRRVRFVGVVTKEDQTVASAVSPYVSNLNQGRKNLGRRQGPIGCLPPVQLHETPSRNLGQHSLPLASCLSFQPPPKQKQHPILPHNSIHHHHHHKIKKKTTTPPSHHTNKNHVNSHVKKKMINNNNNCEDLRQEQTDTFYKDVEIIL